MKKLADVIPIQLTNSEDKYAWLDKLFKSAKTDDGRVIVAAVAMLIDEVNKLQEQTEEVRSAVDSVQSEVNGLNDTIKQSRR